MRGEQEQRLVVENRRIPLEDPLPEVIPTIDRDRPELWLGWDPLGRSTDPFQLRPRPWVSE